jgi:hypothetical protein
MTEDSRISKLRDYLFNVIDGLNVFVGSEEYEINANMLSNNVGDYSLDKIPTESEVEPYITGGGRYREVYSFKSRKSYAEDAMVNLKNMGFFEKLENAIKSNNDEGVLPDIKGIESIECVTPFTIVVNDNGHKAAFDSQIQIIYEDDGDYEDVPSL